MRVLVTGGGGYIGSMLVPELLNDGHKVVVLDHFSHGVPSLAASCGSGLELVNGDVRDPGVVSTLTKQADAVIPLAGVVGLHACDRDQVAARTTNVDAIVLLCGLLMPSQLLVIPTTNSGYGIGGPKLCDETSPLNPVSLYGRLKAKAEEIALQRENSVSLRLATVFGMSPRMRWHLLVNYMVRAAVRDRYVILFQPHFRRNFIHVRDVANVFLEVLYWGMIGSSKAKGQIYNVGLSNANLTKQELCKRIKQQVPDFVYTVAPVGEDPDQRDYVVSNAKIEGAGWRPVHSLDDGIRELITGCQMQWPRVTNTGSPSKQNENGGNHVVANGKGDR